MLHSILYVVNVPAKFEVALANGLGGDPFTTDAADPRMYTWTDRRIDFGMNLFTLFLKEEMRL